MSKYDVIIIGADREEFLAAYELMQKAPELKVAVFGSREIRWKKENVRLMAKR